MKPTTEQIQVAARILKEVVTSDAVKIRWGMQQRTYIKEAIDRGEKVGGYRVRWLTETKNRLIDELAVCAQEFNRTYKHDKISVQDMADALATTLQRLQQAAQKFKQLTDSD